MPAAAAPSATAGDLTGAYTIVTGGSKGIGLETVKGLMSRGCHVVIAARDMSTCDQVKQQLTNDPQFKAGSCACAQLDLEDPASIQRFITAEKAELKRRNTPLRVLVNNAGVMGVGFTSSRDDRHMLCNHLGPFMLTLGLADNLGNTSRVVNVASRAHKWSSKFEFLPDGSMASPPNFWMNRYGNSKLANIIFTAEIQRRWRDKGVVAVSVSPGFVSTNIVGNLPWPLNYVLAPVFSYIGRTPAQGAATSIYAATSPEVTGSPDELLLHDCKPLKPLPLACDEKIGKLLWDWSERWVTSST